MPVKLNLDIPETEEKLWQDVIVYKTRNNLPRLNDAVVELLKLALKKIGKDGRVEK